jgi:hypothetical protein
LHCDFYLQASAGLLYFPHIACAGDWETEIAIINTSADQTVSGILRPYSEEGGEVSESMSITLSPHARRQITISEEFPSPGAIGYIVFETDSDSIVGYTKFYVQGKYRVALPAVNETNSYDIYISHIASNQDWWTGIALLNTTESAKELTIAFDTNETRSIDLAGREKQTVFIKDLFEGASQPDINSAVIRDASGVVGFELFGSTESSGRKYLSGILLKNETTTNIYYPHIASNDEWWSGVLAYNPSATSCDITITPYRSDGTALASKNVSIEGYGKYNDMVRNLDLPDTTEWLHIASTTPITGFELFGTWDGNQLAGYTGVGIRGSEGVFPKIESDGSGGVAFVNTTDTIAIVTLRAYSDAGELIASETRSVNPKEKQVILDNGFSQDITAATYITYSSDKDLVGFQLNGSSDGMMLDALPGM